MRRAATPSASGRAHRLPLFEPQVPPSRMLTSATTAGQPRLGCADLVPVRAR